MVVVQLFCDYLGAGVRDLRLVCSLTRVGVAQAKVWRMRAAYHTFNVMADSDKVRVFPEWQTYIDNARAEAEILDAVQPDADNNYADNAHAVFNCFLFACRV